MSNAINNLNTLLRSMEPTLNEGVYVFATLDEHQTLPFQEIVAFIREEEGISVVISAEIAEKYQLNAQFKSAWITLTVHSDLAAVGLTAAFATALGKANISCNVVAGNFHYYIFVPYDKAALAMETLRTLQQSS